MLRARLSDARFFWDQDRKAPLESRLPTLDQIVFHAKLGTLGERVERLVALAGDARAARAGRRPEPMAERAARLAKADLVTGMVGEFPELQGIMGRYYARRRASDDGGGRGDPEHYAPRGRTTAARPQPASVAVALADKLDTLVGFFAVGNKPTGSKDPFALRRAALGVIRLVLENGLRLPLRQAFDAALARLRRPAGRGACRARSAELLALLRRPPEGPAARRRACATTWSPPCSPLGDEDDLVRLLARVEALSAFLDSEDGRNLLTAYRRASNIVRIEEKKDKRRYDGAPDPALLREPAERALPRRSCGRRQRIEAALAGRGLRGRDDGARRAARAGRRLLRPGDGERRTSRSCGRTGCGCCWPIRAALGRGRGLLAQIEDFGR